MKSAGNEPARRLRRGRMETGPRRALWARSYLFSALAVCVIVAAAPAQVVPAKKAATRKAVAKSGKPGGAKKPAAKGGCGGSKAVKRGATPLPLNGPPPRFVCDATKIRLEPVWQGKQLRASFTIKNEGEGDLHIKAKGG